MSSTTAAELREYWLWLEKKLAAGVDYVYLKKSYRFRRLRTLVKRAAEQRERGK